MNGIDASVLTSSEIVTDLYRALGSGDVQGVLAHLAEEVIVTEPLVLPYGGTHRGQMTFVESILGVMMTAAEVNLTSADVFEGPAGVVGRLQGSLVARNTGEQLPITMIEVHTIRHGVIDQIDVFLQNPEELAAFYQRAGV